MSDKEQDLKIVDVSLDASEASAQAVRPKPKKKKDILEIIKITVVLFLITVIAGGLLGLVNHFTKIDGDEELAKKLAEFYSTESGFQKVVLDGSSLSEEEIYKNGKLIGVFKPNDNPSKTIFIVEGNGAYSATLQVILLVSEGKIEKIDKYHSAETPGLGSKAFEDDFLNQYKGIDIKSIDKFEVSKNNGVGDIVAVSGATKSSNAVTNAVNVAVLYYKTFSSQLSGGTV